jgi:hypothetical protein
MLALVALKTAVDLRAHVAERSRLGGEATPEPVAWTLDNRTPPGGRPPGGVHRCITGRQSLAVRGPTRWAVIVLGKPGHGCSRRVDGLGTGA